MTKNLSFVNINLCINELNHCIDNSSNEAFNNVLHICEKFHYFDVYDSFEGLAYNAYLGRI